MKVLHVWEIGSDACLMAKAQRELLGWDSHIITRSPFDKYGHIKYYGEEIRSMPAFCFKVLCLTKTLGVDVVHVHAWDEVVPLLSAHKPVIMQYHGSDIRGRWNERKRYWEKAEKIIVSTPDLLDGAPEGTEYLPNPVDTELFSPRPKLRETDSAVHFISVPDDLKLVRKRAEELKLNLLMSRRDLKYHDVPQLLWHFQYLIDQQLFRALSKLALESLACGLRVVDWNGHIHEGLPKEHRPENVAIRLKEIIEGMGVGRR
jgi:glycosyltransferase involved in cell wall biosynthesis